MGVVSIHAGTRFGVGKALAYLSRPTPSSTNAPAVMAIYRGTRLGAPLAYRSGRSLLSTLRYVEILGDVEVGGADEFIRSLLPVYRDGRMLVLAFGRYSESSTNHRIRRVENESKSCYYVVVRISLFVRGIAKKVAIFGAVNVGFLLWTATKQRRLPTPAQATRRAALRLRLIYSSRCGGPTAVSRGGPTRS